MLAAMADLSAPDPAAAAESLLAWWKAAGVDAPPPTNPSQEPSTRRAPAPAREPDRRPAARAAASPPKAEAAQQDARTIAARCKTLDDLKAALESFEHPLRSAARNTVFARGDAEAPVMVVGEAPGREEDLEGLPFVGRSGRLMDRMFAEIGLTAEAGLYITNVVNWRPRNNRNPSEEDLALCRPFIARHVALKRPRFLVLTGAVAAQTLLGVTEGITRLRGRWRSYAFKDDAGGPVEIPALPIYHPAFVLRRPIAKREVWRDLLALKDALAMK